MYALIRQLTARGQEAPPDVLGPIATLRELEAVCESIRSGHEAPHRSNRISLQADALFAFSELGPKVTEQISHLEKDFRSMLGEITAKKGLDASGTVRALALTVGSMLEQLSTPKRLLLRGMTWFRRSPV